MAFPTKLKSAQKQFTDVQLAETLTLQSIICFMADIAIY